MNRILLLSLVSVACVSSGRSQILFDSFGYPDGPIVSVSGGAWATHSGVAGEMDVANGRVHLTEAESEDVSVQLPAGPYSSGNLYSSFIVNFSSLPSGNGNYFASFRSSAFDFRPKVYASTNGAASGKFRLGIATQAFSTALVSFISTDLTLDTDYAVVLRYNADGLSFAASTLWLNPSSESDLANRSDANDSFVVPPPAMAYFSLRQSLFSGNGMGALTLDDLRIGTDFASVVPEPRSAILLGLAFLIWLSKQIVGARRD